MFRLKPLALGFAFLAYGSLFSGASAFVGAGVAQDQLSGGTASLVVRVHNCHNDCQKGTGGASHWHMGMKCIRVSCPGGRKHSPNTPPLDCSPGACIGNPDGSLINHSPLPAPDSPQQQSH